MVYRDSANPPRLVGLCGYARSGKDTVAQILVEKFGFTRVAFADVLKKLAYDANPIIEASEEHEGLEYTRLREAVDDIGWEHAKIFYPEIRETLQRLGVSARDNISSDVWVFSAFNGLSPSQRYVFSDVRFPNEASKIRAEGGAIWRVQRPGTQAVNAHVSETALDSDTPDLSLWNDGDIATLEHKVSRQAALYGW